jgi:hypothetical protein
LAVTAEVVAVSVADVDPAGTTTVAGTAIAALLEASETEAPPVGAALEKVMVHALESPPATDAGLHVIDESEDGADVMLITTDAVTPPEVAVTAPEMMVVLAAAVTVNVAEEAPAGTVTLPGRARASVLVPKATTSPPAGAAVVSVTVQMLDAPAAIVDGLQLSEEMAGPLLPEPPPEPPIAARVRGVPVGSTPRVWLKLMGVEVMPLARLNVTEATTPLVIMLEFIPLAMQV